MQIKTNIVKRKCFDDLVLARCSHAVGNLGSVWLACAGSKILSSIELPEDLNSKILLLTCVLGIPIPAVESMRKTNEKVVVGPLDCCASLFNGLLSI